MPLSTQEYMGTGELLGKPSKLRGSDLRWTSIPSRGSRILLATPCYGNQDKLWKHEPVLASRLHLFTVHCTVTHLMDSAVYVINKIMVFRICKTIDPMQS